jgi:hypothetical protein
MSLPNFMCIGAAKSGTTSLYDILRQHSDVFIPSFKEPHFFDMPSVYKHGIKWYEKTYFKNAKTEKCIGDFTPSYLFFSEAAEKIKNDLGEDIKFIILLRNPVDRAYSHYLHSVRDERESLSFLDAIKMEEKRLNEYQKKNDLLNYIRHSYIKQSKYAEMIEAYFDVFSSDNFLILHFEDEFIKNRKHTIEKVLEFLGLENTKELKIDVKSNPASKAKSKKIKRLMQKTGWWRIVIKNMIPSLKMRQIIKNRIQRANLNEFIPPQLSEFEKQNIFEVDFKDDVNKLEILLGRKMNWNK